MDNIINYFAGKGVLFLTFSIISFNFALLIFNDKVKFRYLNFIAKKLTNLLYFFIFVNSILFKFGVALSFDYFVFDVSLKYLLPIFITWLFIIFYNRKIKFAGNLSYFLFILCSFYFSILISMISSDQFVDELFFASGIFVLFTAMVIVKFLYSINYKAIYLFALYNFVGISVISTALTAVYFLYNKDIFVDNFYNDKFLFRISLIAVFDFLILNIFHFLFKVYKYASKIDVFFIFFNLILLFILFLSLFYKFYVECITIFSVMLMFYKVRKFMLFLLKLKINFFSRIAVLLNNFIKKSKPILSKEYSKVFLSIKKIFSTEVMLLCVMLFLALGVIIFV